MEPEQAAKLLQIAKILAGVTLLVVFAGVFVNTVALLIFHRRVTAIEQTLEVLGIRPGRDRK